MTIIDYEQHPIGALWPDVSGTNRVEFFKDVADNGVREPAVIFEGKILDGWQRYRAAKAAGAYLPTTEYDGDDPVRFVISKNAARRHLTKIEVTKAVLKCRNWQNDGRPAKPRHDDEVSEPDRPRTNREIADEAGSSESTVRRAKEELRAEEAGDQQDDDVESAPSPKQLLMMRVGALEDKVRDLEREISERDERIELLRSDVSPEASAREAKLNDLQQNIRVLRSQSQQWQQKFTDERRHRRALEKQIKEMSV